VAAADLPGLNPQSSLLDEEREKQMSTLLASLPAQTQPVQTEDGDTTAAPTVPAEATPPGLTRRLLWVRFKRPPLARRTVA